MVMGCINSTKRRKFDGQNYRKQSVVSTTHRFNPDDRPKFTESQMKIVTDTWRLVQEDISKVGVVTFMRWVGIGHNIYIYNAFCCILSPVNAKSLHWATCLFVMNRYFPTRINEKHAHETTRYVSYHQIVNNGRKTKPLWNVHYFLTIILDITDFSKLVSSTCYDGRVTPKMQLYSYDYS